MNPDNNEHFDDYALTFTQSQFEALLLLVQLGHWMANGIRIENDRYPGYDHLLQYIFSSSQQFGFGDSIVYDDKQQTYLPAEGYEMSSGIEEIKKRYDDEMFWAELVERFANRDTAQEMGEEQLKKSSRREWLEKRTPYLQKYIQEFDKNGIKNLKLNESVNQYETS